MTRFNIAILVALLFLSVELLHGQRGPKHHRDKGFALGQIDHLKEDLQLTEAQVAEIEIVKQDLDEKLKALKDQEFESHEDRRDAFKTIRTELKTALDNLLTEEQKALLEEKRKERSEHFRKGRGMKDKEELGKALKEYHDQNIQPALLAERAKLEEKISEEDQATLVSLREQLKDLKRKGRRPHKKDMHPRRSEREMRGHSELSDEQKSALAALKDLTEKYNSEIEVHLSNLQGQREKWAEEMKQIRSSFIEDHRRSNELKEDREKPSQFEGRRRQGIGMEGRRELEGRRGEHSKRRFLLLAPVGEVLPDPTKKTAVFNQVNVFPNPSAFSNTLNYHMQEAGKIRVELRRESGGLVKVLLDDYREVGKHQLEVDFAGLNDGVYYITLIDAQGMAISEKVIISK